MARPLYRRLLDVTCALLLALSTLLCPTPGVSADLTAVRPLPQFRPDFLRNTQGKQAAEAAIEQVIRAQIDAFSRDDGVAAFSFAGPKIRQRFGHPDRFMEMVISGFPMIYRPSRLEFGPLDYQSETTALQPIGVGDTAGKVWLAIYAMVRLEDGTWRIAGVQIKATGGQQI